MNPVEPSEIFATIVQWSVSPGVYVPDHTNPEQAGTIFNKVKPKLAVYSHIVPFDAPDLTAHTRKTYSGPLEVGEDLMSFEIGDEVKVRHASEIVGGPQSPR